LFFTDDALYFLRIPRDTNLSFTHYLLLVLAVVDGKPLIATPAEIATTTTAGLGSAVLLLLLRTILAEPVIVLITTATPSLRTVTAFFVWVNIGTFPLINSPFVIQIQNWFVQIRWNITVA
jgi:hypothetical protein